MRSGAGIMLSRLTRYHELMPADANPARSLRVAFLGGSFDPPHRGHLAVARAALQALHLDRVLFAPVGSQPLKPQGSSASFEQRVAMTRLAIANQPGSELSLADASLPDGSPNYTWDSLQTIRAALPPDSDLFCLMGADSLAGIRRWHRAADLLFAAPFIVASRPGEQLDDLTALLPEGLVLESAPATQAGGIELRCYLLRNAAGVTAPFYLLPGLHVDISATAIRSGQQASTLLPGPVSEYIRAHKLYP